MLYLYYTSMVIWFIETYYIVHITAVDRFRGRPENIVIIVVIKYTIYTYGRVDKITQRIRRSN